jgi:hypothetical protein
MRSWRQVIRQPAPKNGGKSGKPQVNHRKIIGRSGENQVNFDHFTSEGFLI